MSHIDLHHPHALSLEEARKAIDEVAAKLSARFAMDCAWEGDTLRFTRSGVEGRIALLPGQLHVTAKLGFLLAAMKGQIEQEIRRVLAERFG
jgi:putative polyhydroxyalkanoate system protein